VSDDDARLALRAWAGMAEASLAPLYGGLINRSFRVDGANGRFVLQWLHPIFDPRLHENIAAVTARLVARGMVTPTLVPTSKGELYSSEPSGVWRLYTFVDGTSFAMVANRDQARAAGELVGRFHAAVADIDHRFVALRSGVHDTERHIAALEAALLAHRDHRLHAEVDELAKAIFDAHRALPPVPALALQVGHGDLKLSNLLFERDAPTRALCLVDLDTVGPIHLAHELGDMWRSWCNRAGEDDAQAVLDLDVLDASWHGWVAGLGRAPSPSERESALVGIEIISLELAARFAADALVETYFRFDAARFPARGEHNLLRARGQWSLHLATLRTRGDRHALM
jgi:Ser/Thr protein kinase RdoA (MazF antagonist)